MSDMKVTSRDFQREFSRMKAAAKAGEPVFITSGDEEFVFQAVQKRSWQGALKGKGKVVGDLFTTGLDWEASE
jgi:antitoxin (DNA-binding transcriptional repressor) of toxin-antitoxin stability system